MKLKEQLKNLGLSDEQSQKVIDEIIDKQYVSKADYDAVSEENKTLKGTVADRDKQLEKLKTSAGDNENLKKQIEDLQAKNKKAAAEYAENIKALKIDSAVESAIRDAKGKNVKAVKALLDIDSSKIAVNEKGELVGLDIEKQLKALQSAEDSSFLFLRSGSFRGVQPERSSGKEPGDEFPEKGSYEDMAAWFEAHSGDA